MTVTSDLREPAVGTAVRLLPVAAGGERVGRLTEWSTSPAGLVVTAAVELDAEDAEALLGARVWARMETGDGAACVLEAVADAGFGQGELLLTGVLALAAERRRSEPRVELVRRAALRTPAGAPPGVVPVQGASSVTGAPARTVDLSRSGARLELPLGTGPVQHGAGPIEVTVEVADGQVLTVTARVVRVDEAQSQIAVRFVDLTGADSERIDRAVLAELSSQRSAEDPSGS